MENALMVHGGYDFYIGTNVNLAIKNVKYFHLTYELAAKRVRMPQNDGETCLCR